MGIFFFPGKKLIDKPVVFCALLLDIDDIMTGLLVASPITAAFRLDKFPGRVCAVCFSETGGCINWDREWSIGQNWKKKLIR